MIDVSVVIPVYNIEKYLKETLESVIKQTKSDIEIICVDDGSTDSSKDILYEYAQKDSRIKIFEQENSGAGVARNIGFKQASGKYVAFLDSDDIYELDMLEKMYDKAEKHHLDVVVCRSDKFTDCMDNAVSNNGCIKKYLLPAQEVFSSFDIKKNFFMVFIWWPWDKLFRKKHIEQLALEFQGLRTTNDLFFVASAVVAADRIACIDEVLAHHRVGNKHTLSVTREKSWDCFKIALDALKEFLIYKELYPRFKRDFINYCLHFSLWHLETLKGKSFFLLYKKLGQEWFKDLGLLEEPISYYYDRGLYRMMKYIVNNRLCNRVERTLIKKNSINNVYYDTYILYLKLRIYYKGYGLKRTIKKIYDRVM